MHRLITIAAALMVLGSSAARAEVSVPAATVEAYLKDIEGHLRNHQKYPATRAQLISACFDLKDFSPEEKKWFIGTLPDRTYGSADEVLAALRGAP